MNKPVGLVTAMFVMTLVYYMIFNPFYRRHHA
jgi:hypothetical protein